MQMIWQHDDAWPGRRYSKPGIEEVWMIGYCPDNADSVVSISLDDGVITRPVSKICMAETLTKSGYVPLEFMEKSNETWYMRESNYA